MKLCIEINVTNENRLREIAAHRMARSGFEDDPTMHLDNPLHELVFEALVGSNPDDLSPNEMGIEIINWTDLDEA